MRRTALQTLLVRCSAWYIPRPALPAKFQFDILPQPDEVTCGPTCLHAIYRYWGDAPPLEQVIREVRMVDGGGTLGVHLAQHALRRGYRARIYTYNLQVFDPTWFSGGADLRDKVRQRRDAIADPAQRLMCDAYLDYLDGGGDLRFRDLTASLIRHYLQRDVPILTGLSATYLYRAARELPHNAHDDVRGAPAGHFVVLCGYDRSLRKVLVADPYARNPVAGQPVYEVGIERVLGAILLGVLTHDGNLLVLLPPAVPVVPDRTPCAK